MLGDLIYMWLKSPRKGNGEHKNVFLSLCMWDLYVVICVAAGMCLLQDTCRSLRQPWVLFLACCEAPSLVFPLRIPWAGPQTCRGSSAYTMSWLTGFGGLLCLCFLSLLRSAETTGEWYHSSVLGIWTQDHGRYFTHWAIPSASIHIFEEIMANHFLVFIKL